MMMGREGLVSLRPGRGGNGQLRTPENGNELELGLYKKQVHKVSKRDWNNVEPEGRAQVTPHCEVWVLV